MINRGIFQRTYRRLSYSSSELLRVKPVDFNALHTNYGWVLIPKTHFAYRWTKQHIHKEIEEKYPDIGKNTYTNAEIQEVVDKWIKTVDIDEKPSSTKLKKADIRKQKEESMYRAQLREEFYEDEMEKTTGSPKAKDATIKKTKKRTKNEAITFIHAWNYFFSVKHPNYSHLGKVNARKEISQEWNMMTVEEKEVYREEYSKLLAKGMDIYKGKIVTREEKLKKLPKHKRKPLESKLDTECESKPSKLDTE